MDLTILGSGTSVPRPDRFPAGYLLQHEGQNIAVDLGPGVTRRLHQAGVDLGDLHAILFTHYHTDHCADLAALLFGLRSHHYSCRGPLHVYGAPGLVELVGHLRAAWPWTEPKGYELELHEIEPGAFDVGSLHVQAIDIEHTVESLGYRVAASDGGVAAFTGDAIECEGLLPLARDVDVFVCDAAFPDASPGVGHMTAGQAGRAAAAAGCRTLVLTHFYPECEGHDLIAEAGEAFAGRILMAEDLLRIPVRA